MNSIMKGKADLSQGGFQCQAEGSDQHQLAGLWPLETNVCVTQPGVSITQMGGVTVLKDLISEFDKGWTREEGAGKHSELQHLSD